MCLLKTALLSANQIQEVNNTADLNGINKIFLPSISTHIFVTEQYTKQHIACVPYMLIFME